MTVTHPEMTRYFMTIPEAVQLVIQAGAIGGRGEVFVLDMGEPVKIIDLAEQHDPALRQGARRDIAIEIVGARPGEKLHEELWSEGEHGDALDAPEDPPVTRAADRRRLARGRSCESSSGWSRRARRSRSSGGSPRSRASRSA